MYKSKFRIFLFAVMGFCDSIKFAYMYIQFFLKCIISGSVIKLCSVCGRPHRTKSIEPIPTFRPLNEDIDMKVIVRSVCKCCNVEIHSHIQRTFSPTFITECKWDFIIGHLIVLTLDMADCVVDFFPIPFPSPSLFFTSYLFFPSIYSTSC